MRQLSQIWRFSNELNAGKPAAARRGLVDTRRPRVWQAGEVIGVLVEQVAVGWRLCLDRRRFVWAGASGAGGEFPTTTPSCYPRSPSRRRAVVSCRVADGRR